MIKKIFLTLFFTIVFVKNSLAYYDFDKKLEKAYTLIMAFHFDEAQILLKQEKIEKPGNDLRLLYLNYIDFLKAFVSEDKSEYENLKRNTSLRLDEMTQDKNNSASPFHLYSQSEILIQQALAGFKFGDNLISAGEMRKAYKLINKNKTIFPLFILNEKVLGFLHSVFGSVPLRYQWIVNLAGIEGDVNQGLNELNELYRSIDSTSLSSYRIEILFYIGNIHFVFSSPSDSVPGLNQMKQLVGVSPLIAYIYSNILMKEGRNYEAISVLDLVLKDNTTYPFYFLYYKRGLAGLRNLESSSENYFKFFLANYKGKNNVKACYQKLAWLALLKGDSVKYFNYMKLCKDNGKLYLDEDKEAQSESESGEIQNIILLRSRLYFDGGYYNSAFKELNNKSIENFPRFRDQLEVAYRFGRILQMINQTDKAINYFQMTIKNGENSKYYFAANSSLMLGQIFEERNQLDKAKFYYQKCFTMKNDDYKNSIDQKARAGIQRIRIKENEK